MKTVTVETALVIIIPYNLLDPFSFGYKITATKFEEVAIIVPFSESQFDICSLFASGQGLLTGVIGNKLVGNTSATHLGIMRATLWVKS